MQTQISAFILIMCVISILVLNEIFVYFDIEDYLLIVVVVLMLSSNPALMLIGSWKGGKKN